VSRTLSAWLRRTHFVQFKQGKYQLSIRSFSIGLDNSVIPKAVLVFAIDPGKKVPSSGDKEGKCFL
jgi:hypothetical protein